jgi:hypothetical protein
VYEAERRRNDPEYRARKSRIFKIWALKFREQYGVSHTTFRRRRQRNEVNYD